MGTRRKYPAGSAKSVFGKLGDSWSPASHGRQSRVDNQDFLLASFRRKKPFVLLAYNDVDDLCVVCVASPRQACSR